MRECATVAELASGTLNGLCYFALALSLRQGERWRTAHGAAAVCRYGLLTVLLLLCVLADPVWLLGIAFWFCTAGGRPETATDDTADRRRTWARRIALLAGLSLAAWLDHRFLPRPLDFNLDFFLPVYGFRNAFAFWGQSQAYAYLFLWAGWAYLLFRYVCRRDCRAIATLLTLTGVFIALFGFQAGYPADFGRRFLPLWVMTALLVLQEQRPAIWLAPAVLFLICGSADGFKTLDRRAGFYGTFADHLPERYDKFLAYNIAMPEYSFQPSGIPQVEMLNYTLLHTARPRVVLFPLPGVAFQSPYEADLSFLVADGLLWPADLLNPNYFENLSPGAISTSCQPTSSPTGRSTPCGARPRPTRATAPTSLSSFARPGRTAPSAGRAVPNSWNVNAPRQPLPAITAS